MEISAYVAAALVLLASFMFGVFGQGIVVARHEKKRAPSRVAARGLCRRAKFLGLGAPSAGARPGLAGRRVWNALRDVEQPTWHRLVHDRVVQVAHHMLEPLLVVVSAGALSPRRSTLLASAHAPGVAHHEHPRPVPPSGRAAWYTRNAGDNVPLKREVAPR